MKSTRIENMSASATSLAEGLRVEVLTADPEIQGQKYCCLSMISPESRQKSKVHALKVRYVCDDIEEAKLMAKRLRDNDPDFDVMVADVGKWLPWVWSFDDLPNQEYAETQLNELIAGHKQERQKADEAFKERLQKERKANELANSKEGLERRLAQGESSYSVYFKMLQLEKVIAERQRELEAFRAKFESETYTDDERELARGHTYPEIIVAPSQFQSDENDATSKA